MSNPVHPIHHADGVIYHWRAHEIIENWWIKDVRRMTARDDLFLYRHRFTKAWVLAQWIMKPVSPLDPGVMNELFVSEEKPIWLEVPMQVVRGSLKPVSVARREMRRKLDRAERQKKAEKAAEHDYIREYVDFLRKKGEYKLALAIERGDMGMIPEWERDDTHRELADFYKWLENQNCTALVP